MSVTISGCPSIRSRFFGTSTEFRSLQRKEIPIRGPYHAYHLYDKSDIDRILDDDISTLLRQYSVVYPLIGLSSKPPTSTVQLFHKAILEILAHQVHWDRLV